MVKSYVPASDSSTGVRIKQTIVAVREIRSSDCTQRLFLAVLFPGEALFGYLEEVPKIGLPDS